MDCSAGNLNTLMLPFMRGWPAEPVPSVFLEKLLMVCDGPLLLVSNGPGSSSHVPLQT